VDITVTKPGIRT